MPTPLMNNTTRLSCVGNSKSPEMSVDNRSTHHHNHRQDAQKEVEVEEGVEMEEEMEEVDYLLWLDQAYSLHTDELLTLTSF
jgi:hypothetical protein